MRQRFLNQKLGKRTSRRAAIQKAKTLFNRSNTRSNPRLSGYERPSGKDG